MATWAYMEPQEDLSDVTDPRLCAVVWWLTLDPNLSRQMRNLIVDPAFRRNGQLRWRRILARADELGLVEREIEQLALAASRCEEETRANQRPYLPVTQVYTVSGLERLLETHQLRDWCDPLNR